MPYKMAAVEQETYGNKLAPHVVYTSSYVMQMACLKSLVWVQV